MDKNLYKQQVKSEACKDREISAYKKGIIRNFDKLEVPVIDKTVLDTTNEPRYLAIKGALTLGLSVLHKTMIHHSK